MHCKVQWHRHLEEFQLFIGFQHRLDSLRGYLHETSKFGRMTKNPLDDKNWSSSSYFVRQNSCLPTEFRKKFVFRVNRPLRHVHTTWFCARPPFKNTFWKSSAQVSLLDGRQTIWERRFASKSQIGGKKKQLNMKITNTRFFFAVTDKLWLQTFQGHEPGSDLT
jgi:hypothetical protein